MLKIQCSDAKKTELIYLVAEEGEAYYNGASRRTMTLQCASDAMGLDKLHTLLADEAATATLTCTDNATGAKNVYSGYVLPLELGVQSVRIADETPDTAAEYGQCLAIKLGKRTYQEQQLINIEQQLAQLSAAK